MFSALPSTDCGRAKPAGVAGGCCRSAYWGRASFGSVLVHCPADVDDVISDHAEGDPALHPDEALVAAAAETMSAFDHADASFATGAPLLAVAEPALLLLAFAFGAFGRTIGNADALDTLCFGCRLVLIGIERRVGCEQARCTAQQGLMHVDG